MKFVPAVEISRFRLGGGARRSYIAVFVIVVAITGFVIAPTQHRTHQWSKADLAELVVKKYAYEAYPTWQHANPSRACPARLADLDDYMNMRDRLDPWGRAYRWACTDHLIVSSAGQDGRFDSDDDIASGP